MAQRTAAAFKTNVNAQITTNGTGQVTASKVRTALGEDTADSFLNISDHLQDDDTFASASASKVASSESVKAYVDVRDAVTASGTDTYTATITPAPAAYVTGKTYLIKFTNANTGAATLNLNSLGAKSIKKNGSTALASGDITAGQTYWLSYDGTNLQIVGRVSSGGVSGLTANRIPYATSATVLSDDSGLTWDATNDRMQVTGGIAIGGAATSDLSGNVRANIKNTTGNCEVIIESPDQTGIISLKGTRASSGLDGGSVKYYNNANNIAAISASRTANTDEGYVSILTKKTSVAIAERIRITEDGRVYGTAIHNNSGAVTGATNQYIASGTYTPTLTNISNTSARTAYECQWMRVGNVVTYSGSFDLTVTAGATTTQISMNPPIASGFTVNTQAGGVASNNDGSHAVMFAEAVGDSIYVAFISGATGAMTFRFTCTYQIL